MIYIFRINEQIFETSEDAKRDFFFINLNVNGKVLEVSKVTVMYKQLPTDI